MEAPQPAQAEQAPAPPRPEPPKEAAEIHLEQEKIAEVRRRKAQAQQRDREAQRLKTELGRRRSLRSIREGGYIREAEIDSRMQRHMAAVRMELRQQAQDLAAAYPPQAAGQYAQYAAPAEAPAPQMDIQA